MTKPKKEAKPLTLTFPAAFSRAHIVQGIVNHCSYCLSEIASDIKTFAGSPKWLRQRAAVLRDLAVRCEYAATLLEEGE